MLKQKTIFPLINKLFEGDCLEYMKLIPDKSVDMILCDLIWNNTK